MELVSSAWHVVSAFLIFVAGLFWSLWLGKRFKSTRHRPWILYLWHTLFCLVYIILVMQSGGDAIGYFDDAVTGNVEFEFGTAAVSFLSYLFVSIGHISFLGVFLVFNIFGYIGLLAFDSSLRIATTDKTKRVKMLASLIVFMPSVSFWSSAIGKDALSFMAIGLALWAAIDFRHRQGLMVFAVLIILMVRPHIAGMMVLALAASQVLDPKVKLKTRFILGSMAIAASVSIVPFALTYAGLADASNAGNVQDYVNQRQRYNMEGGGGVDIATMSLPMQLFTYLFRPVIFEARNVTTLAAALDNMLLLLMMAMALLNYFKRHSFRLIGQRTFMWLYVMMTWVVLATTTANLGIAIRQKWMFVPFIVFLLIPYIGKSKRRTNAASARMVPQSEHKPRDLASSRS